MAQTFSNLLIHVIFSTKNREPHIDPQLKPDLMGYTGGIVREMKGCALAINGTADHVHLLLRLPPTISVADALRVLKTNSSRWVHENSRSRRGFGWQAGYGAFSVSESNIPDVIRYISNQETHHRRIRFQEEFVTFLKKHKIKYDERYIWE